MFELHVTTKQLKNSVVKKSLIFFSTLLFSSLTHAASGITYHGRILRPGGLVPVNSLNTQFRIQIQSPNGCLLWEEMQTKDLSNTEGVFTITIADNSEPTLIPNTLPYALERVFSNRTAFTGVSSCTVGTAYNPSSGDGRNLQVYFREAPTAPWEQMPLTKVNFVPLALNSVQLEGFASAEFLKVASNSVYTPLTAANVNTLLDLIAGTSTQYVSSSAAFVGDVTGNAGATVVNRIRGTNVVATAPTVNQVLKFDGTNWAPSADATGGAPVDSSYAAKGIVQIDTSLATSGLNVAAGVLSLPNVVVAGGPIGSTSVTPVITYDAKGRLTAVTSATINDSSKLPLAGGTMTGPINMGTQNITNATSMAATNFSGRNFVLNDNDTNTITVRAPVDVTPVNYSLTLPATAGTAGYVLSTDGTGNLSWIIPSTGSVTSVSSANPYITVGTGTTTPLITAVVGQVANTLAAGNDSRIVGALQTTTYAADLLPAVSCTAAQKPSWNTVSDLWECLNIGSLDASAITTGTVATARLGAGTADSTTFLRGDGAWAAAGLPLNSMPIYKVRVATTGGITLSAPQTIDGVALVAGDRVLVKNQGSSNGVYVVAAGAWVRAVDMSTWLSTVGYTAQVSEGSAWAGMTFVSASTAAGAIGTTVINWSAAGSAATNTANGVNALNGNPLGTDNTANGFRALQFNSNGYNNTANGSGALYWNSGGYNNTANGVNALYSNTSGFNNIGNGVSALFSNTSGANNTANGVNALYSNTFGDGNTANGNFALNSNTGVYNTALGYSSGSAITTGSYNVVIGANSGSSFATSSYNISISDGVGTERIRVLASGHVGIGINSPNSRLDINGAVSQRGITAAVAGLSPAGQGRMYFDSTSNTFKISQNGGAYADILTSASGGITSLGGLTAGIQTFASGATGTAPAFVSATSTHTLNIPLASGAGVTSGTISKAEYDKFNNGTTISGTSGGIPYFNSATTQASSGLLTANGVLLGGGAGAAPTSTAAGTANQVLRVPAAGGAPVFGTIDLAVAVNGILPIANGGTNSATALTNGKVMISTAGAIIEGMASATTKTINTFVMRDGTGGVTGALGTFDQLALNGSVAGTLNVLAPSSFTTWSMTLPTTAGIAGQFLSTNGAGVTSWATALISTTGFMNGGNSFGAAATLGTNDAFDLNIETGGTTKMTILNNGNVGIGTTNPLERLHVEAPIVGYLLNSTTGSTYFNMRSPVGEDSIISANRLLQIGTDGGDIQFGTGTGGTMEFLMNERMRINQNGNVGIGSIAPSSPLSVTPLQYNTGTASQSLTTITGVGTVFTAAMVGSQFVFANGVSAGSITAVGTATSLTVATSQTVAPQAYAIGYTGLQVASNGNVGIGTMTPSDQLHVYANTGAFTGLTIENPNATGNPFIRLKSGASRGAIIYLNSNASDIGYLAAASDLATLTLASTAGNSLRFGTNGVSPATAPKMIIDTAGNVGIGTTAPTTKLNIVTAGTADDGLKVESSGGTLGPYLSLKHGGTGGREFNIFSTGSTNGPGAGLFEIYDRTAAATRLVIGASGNVGIGTAAPGAPLHVSYDSASHMLLESGGINVSAIGIYGTVLTLDHNGAGGRSYTMLSTGSSNYPGAGYWGLFDNTVNAASSYRILVAPNGNVGIGTGATAGTEKLHVQGNLRVQGTTDCTLGNGAGGTNCSSDARLKMNIQEIVNPMGKILSLRGVEFDWNEKSGSPGRHDIGVIAQDVEKVFPTAVIEDSATGFKKVDYAVLVAPLIQAFKDMHKRVEALFKTSQDHSRRVASVEAENARLKSSDFKKAQEIVLLKAESEKQKRENQAIKAYLCGKDPSASICK